MDGHSGVLNTVINGLVLGVAMEGFRPIPSSDVGGRQDVIEDFQCPAYIMYVQHAPRLM